MPTRCGQFERLYRPVITLVVWCRWYGQQSQEVIALTQQITMFLDAGSWKACRPTVHNLRPSIMKFAAVHM